MFTLSNPYPTPSTKRKSHALNCPPKNDINKNKLYYFSLYTFFSEFNQKLSNTSIDKEDKKIHLPEKTNETVAAEVLSSFNVLVQKSTTLAVTL